MTMKPVLIAFMIVLVPGLGAGQTSSPDAATQMVRAAGMPLRDGALAPGMLTVRVVEGAFTKDFADQLVEVEVAGGKIDSARTGADGRAQFAHLPVGARVRAWASVGGERLESESFEMPGESGVRVLLVAGASAGTTAPLATSTTELPPNHPPISETPSAPPALPSASGASGSEGVTAIRAVLLTTTIFAFGLVWLRRHRR
jgi:hypothetical protein